MASNASSLGTKLIAWLYLSLFFCSSENDNRKSSKEYPDPIYLILTGGEDDDGHDEEGWMLIRLWKHMFCPGERRKVCQNGIKLYRVIQFQTPPGRNEPQNRPNWICSGLGLVFWI